MSALRHLADVVLRPCGGANLEQPWRSREARWLPIAPRRAGLRTSPVLMIPTNELNAVLDGRCESAAAGRPDLFTLGMGPESEAQ